MPSGYGSVNHVVSVRLRLQGTGTFISRLAALEDDPEQNLADTTMSLTANRPVSLLANIASTRIQFHGSTEEIDEYFVVKSLIFYVKPTATGYLQ